MKTKRGLITLAFTLLLSGCATIPEMMPSEMSPVTPCSEPRPQICTMNYLPVCGQLSDSSSKTYSNGCNACSNPQVVGYLRGECQ